MKNEIMLRQDTRSGAERLKSGHPKSVRADDRGDSEHRKRRMEHAPFERNPVRLPAEGNSERTGRKARSIFFHADIQTEAVYGRNAPYDGNA